jgi:hypothetical protein
MAEKQELQIRNNYDLAKPVEMVSMAKVLKHHIVGQKLYTNIVGKNYAHVEGWQFAGDLMELIRTSLRLKIFPTATRSDGRPTLRSSTSKRETL